MKQKEGKLKQEKEESKPNEGKLKQEKEKKNDLEQQIGDELSFNLNEEISDSDNNDSFKNSSFNKKKSHNTNKTQSSDDNLYLNVDTNRKVQQKTALRKKYINDKYKICGDSQEKFVDILNKIENNNFNSSSSIGELNKKTKKNIPPSLKNQIWRNYIGNEYKGKCYCCLDTVITANSFSAGHIIPESKGGSLNISNLRPICQSCNSSMRDINMFKYMEDNKIKGWEKALLQESINIFISLNIKGEYQLTDFYKNYCSWCKRYKVMPL